MTASGTLVIVDGSQLVNEVCRSLGAADAVPGVAPFLTSYLSHWFDIDRLLAASVIEARQLNAVDDLGIVIFHSAKALGPDGRIARERPAIMDFWCRQGSNPNSSSHLVEVPGAPIEREAGISAAVLVHLFETLDEWRLGVLVTTNAEFVPAVWALRRRGKRILCCSLLESGTSPLVHAAQHFVPLNLGFVKDDFALARLYGPHGPVAEVLRQPELEHLDWQLDGPRLTARIGQSEHDFLRPFLEKVRSSPSSYGYGHGAAVAFHTSLTAASIELGHELRTTPYRTHLVTGVTRHQQQAIAQLLAAIKPEVADAEPTEAEAIETEPTKPEAIEPEAIETEPTKPEAIRPEAIKPEAIKPEAIKPEAIKPEAIKPEAIETEPAKPEAIRPEAIKPEAIETKPG